MDPHFALKQLDAVAAQLPFHVNDTERANEAFVLWRGRGRAETEEIVDLWTYCFARRYFLLKLMREPEASVADFEALIDKAFRNIEQHRRDIQDATRYASWVSVVCRNAFLNYVRGRRRMVSIDASGIPVVAGPEVHHDAGLMLQAVLAAIARLPAFLQETAYFRFVKDYSYEEIGEATGRKLPIIRSYVNKAVKRFRKDERLCAYLEQAR